MSDGPADKRRYVAKELENSVSTDEKSKCSVINHHRIGQPSAIIQNNIMQRPVA
jgi:hypothetical protein